MDDRIEGAGKQVVGSIGKITGNRNIEAQGAAEKAAGKAQAELGEVRSAARDTLDK